MCCAGDVGQRLAPSIHPCSSSHLETQKGSQDHTTPLMTSARGRGLRGPCKGDGGEPGARVRGANRHWGPPPLLRAGARSGPGSSRGAAPPPGSSDSASRPNGAPDRQSGERPEWPQPGDPDSRAPDTDGPGVSASTGHGEGGVEALGRVRGKGAPEGRSGSSPARPAPPRPPGASHPALGPGARRGTCTSGGLASRFREDGADAALTSPRSRRAGRPPAPGAALASPTRLRHLQQPMAWLMSRLRTSTSWNLPLSSTRRAGSGGETGRHPGFGDQRFWLVPRLGSHRSVLGDPLILSRAGVFCRLPLCI